MEGGRRGKGWGGWGWVRAGWRAIGRGGEVGRLAGNEPRPNRESGRKGGTERRCRSAASAGGVAPAVAAAISTFSLLAFAGPTFALSAMPVSAFES